MPNVTFSPLDTGMKKTRAPSDVITQHGTIALTTKYSGFLCAEQRSEFAQVRLGAKTAKEQNSGEGVFWRVVRE